MPPDRSGERSSTAHASPLSEGPPLVACRSSGASVKIFGYSASRDWSIPWSDELTVAVRTGIGAIATMPANESDTKESRLAWLRECERRIGYEFADKDLFFEALTHASSSGSRLDSNERLEFLGDAVLGFTVCEFLYQRYPEWLEGELTQIKSILVSRRTCARLGRELHLDQCLVLGKGVTRENAIPSSVVANAFESTIAAIYLDRGFEVVQRFILAHLEKEVHAAVSGKLERNHKSEFQQYCQKHFGESPQYLLLASAGPDHSKMFEVCAVVVGRRFAPALGPNKKIAEQHAAGNAMAEIMEQTLPFPIPGNNGSQANAP